MLSSLLPCLLLAPTPQVFGAPVDVTFGFPGIVDQFLMDVDLDGDEDFVVVCDGGVYFVEQAIDATFRPGATLFESDGALVDGAAIDLTGDGVEDLVALDGAAGDLHVLRGLPGGGLDDAVAVANVGVGARFVEFADVLGDSELDLIVATTTQGILALENEGALQFGVPVLVGTAPIVAASLATADLDGNGFVDVLFGTDVSDRVGWVPNLGVGGFTNERFIDNGMLDATDVELVDIDGDSDLDLLVAWRGSDRIDWYENIQVGLFFDRGPLFDGIAEPVQIIADDLDDDGDRDLIATFAGDGSVQWAEALGGGVFAAPSAVVQGIDGPIVTTPIDPDGDDERDLVVASSDGAMSFVPNLGAQSSPRFGPAEEITFRIEGPSELVLADIDGDSRLDVVLAQKELGTIDWILNENDVTFRTVRAIDTQASGVRDIAVADLDGDDVADVAAIRSDGVDRQLTVTYATAPGVFGARQVLDDFLSDPVEIAAVDVDLDDDLDIVVATGQDGVLWYANEGDGTFGRSAPFGGAAVEPTSMQVLDVDDDGAIDLAVVLESAQSFVWYRSNGDGTFGSQVDMSGPLGGGGVGALADLNGDDDVDAAWIANASGEVGWAPNLGGGLFGAPTTIGVAMGVPRSLNARDADGDGDVDLFIAADAGPGVPSVWFAENLATGHFAPLVAVDDTLDLVGDMEVIDVAGDSDYDVMTVRPDLAALRLVRNRSRRFIGSSYCGPGVFNGAGLDGRITAHGTTNVARNDVVLRADRLPPTVFGFFLVSEDPDVPTPIPGGAGLLCLDGAIGRYVGPGQIQAADAIGRIELVIDLEAIPQPNGPMAASAGDTWYFQLWHRDQENGMPTSNFTDALRLTFE